jgi:hypothetical protein
MKTLLITPPLLQPNTPYAATPLLTAWLRANGHDAVQADLSIELLLTLFSSSGIAALCRALEQSPVAPDVSSFLAAETRYRDVIDDVILFLQDRSPSSAKQLAKRGSLPEGTHLSRAYQQNKDFGWNFRGLDKHDRARHLCSLFLDDIAAAATRLDPLFEFSRYGETLSATLTEFRTLKNHLDSGPSPFFMLPASTEHAPTPTGWLDSLTDAKLQEHQPQLVCITVPFPGCLLGALNIARRIKQTHPEIRVALGGGYINTEMRELTDPTIFNYIDYILLDSGMLPLLRLAEGSEPPQLIRTFMREEGSVKYYDCGDAPQPHNALPPPVYDGLPMNRYFGLFEVLNPITRLWSDGRWNKLVLAHGCCWHRCAFCDTSIDYIQRYDPARANTICDWIESVMAETGFNGFHFVDESLPPELLHELCDEILHRGLCIEWWGNIRFEKKISKPLIEKMAAAGCIAVTGGLETCCDRTLQLMRKGITVDIAEQVCSDFAQADIMTHAYLMYGFPTQTLEETFQALETVRHLMESGSLDSAYWHRFALTAHSEVARDPEHFSITLLPETPGSFARNEIPFDGHPDYNLDRVGQALRTAMYNYQHGAGFEIPVSDWL